MEISLSMKKSLSCLWFPHLKCPFPHECVGYFDFNFFKITKITLLIFDAFAYEFGLDDWE